MIFDKIDHNILLNKYENEKISPCLMKWLANFLFERQQSVKIGDIISPTLRLNGAVPQGAILGLEAFIAIVKDMNSCLPIYKYVDDSTLSEIIQKGQETRLLQHAFDQTVEWTKENGMTINPTKTHDMVISGAKLGIAPKITIDGRELN